ncbi:TLD family protein [Tritrichomonas foetus]|uniref:TLD family protein n=1 Tax=Tritrichomonas foetus TaxID=1144522 RepID=A0A1J4KBH3_9EUKA|nr:TLD family protein [Tritrichomonas foetus]|eukprot:OHT08571.1 TLD family protein [Tritrichomonas foetus]
MFIKRKKCMNAAKAEGYHEQSIEDVVKQPVDEWEVEETNRKIKFDQIMPLSEINSSLKMMIRYGIPNAYRQDIWFITSGGLQLIEEIGNIWNEIEQKKSLPRNESIYEAFGFPDMLLFTQGEKLYNFLNVVKNQNRNVIFAPMIPSVASMLLLYLEPDLAYFCLQAMINANEKYFPLSKEKFLASINAVQFLVDGISRKLIEHANSINLKISEVALFILPLIFTPKINKQVSLTIFDAYINEGRKILIRFFIGFLIHIQNELLETSSAVEFMNTVLNCLSLLNSPEELKELINISYSLRLPRRKKILSAEQRALSEHIELYNLNVLPRIEDFAACHFYAPLLATTSKVSGNLTFSGVRRKRITIAQSNNSNIHNGKLINGATYSFLLQNMPIAYQRYDAFPVYLMSVDGNAFSTFLDKGTGKQPFMIIIKTETKVFGAILSEQLKPFLNGRYYGTPSTSVFDVTNRQVYRCSGTNDYFISVSQDTFAVGGPNCAIFIEIGFKKVISECCETFNSPQLTTSNDGDIILDIELYKLSLPNSSFTS